MNPHDAPPIAHSVRTQMNAECDELMTVVRRTRDNTATVDMSYRNFSVQDKILKVTVYCSALTV